MTGRRFARFCAIGVVNTLVHMAGAWLLVGPAGWPLLVSNAVAFVVANIVSFVANARFTFGGAVDVRRYPSFLGASLSALALSTVLVAVADRLGVHYLIAIGVSAGVSAVVGFVLSDRWVFARARRH